MQLLRTLCSFLVIATFFLPAALSAQSTTAEQPAEETTDASTAAQFSAKELQELAAPIALFPDTLLIQILVAATYPLDVVKANQFVQDNADQSSEAFKQNIEAQGWDASVAVLATAFPDTLAKMAQHIDWTETIGTAILAQNDDLLDAIQVKRGEAEAAGNLVSGDEQTIEVTQEDSGAQTIIIEPTDPQVVYVPQYNTQTVYVPQETSETTSSSSGTNDALTTALIFFGTAIVMDAIFNDDDDWYGYWGCRDCCGWRGRPIYHDPRRIKIGNNRNVIINNGDVNVRWRPAPGREVEARRKIEARKRPGGATTLPARTPNRGDQLRRDLRTRTGTADISRPQNRDALTQTREQRSPLGDRDGADNALDRTKRPAAQRQVQDSRAARQPAARAKEPVTRQNPAARQGGGAMRQNAPAARAHSGSARGRAAHGGAGSRRR